MPDRAWQPVLAPLAQDQTLGTWSARVRLGQVGVRSAHPAECSAVALEWAVVVHERTATTLAVSWFLSGRLIAARMLRFGAEVARRRRAMAGWMLMTFQVAAEKVLPLDVRDWGATWAVEEYCGLEAAVAGEALHHREAPPAVVPTA